MKAYVKNQVRLTNTRIMRFHVGYDSLIGMRYIAAYPEPTKRLSSGRDMYHVRHRLQRNYQR